jgi:hypothetical protein
MDENENFEALQRLLALKRHETPPPGYFNNFSGKIIARIESGEHRRLVDPREVPWFLKLLQVFEAKPAFAGAFAGSLCLLLVFGIVNAERTDITASQPILIQEAANTAPAAPESSPELSTSSQPSSQAALALNSTNPVLDLQATAQQPLPVNQLFGQSTPASVQDVSFTPPGQQ